MQDNLHYIHYVIVVNLYSSRVKALLLQRMMIKDDVLADCNLYLPIVCLVKLLSGVRKYLTHWTQRPIFYPKSQLILNFFVKIKVEVWTLISGKFEACNNSNWIFGLNYRFWQQCAISFVQQKEVYDYFTVHEYSSFLQSSQ